MTETHIEIEPEDVDLASFDIVIDIGTDRSIPRPYPDALMTSYDQLTLHPDSYVTSNARILVVCDRGVSSRTAVVALRSRGYQHDVSLAGGARGTEGLGGGANR
jgi:rhodanese-related sulfurtransferase